MKNFTVRFENARGVLISKKVKALNEEMAKKEVIRQQQLMRGTVSQFISVEA